MSSEDCQANSHFFMCYLLFFSWDFWNSLYLNLDAMVMIPWVHLIELDLTDNLWSPCTWTLAFFTLESFLILCLWICFLSGALNFLFIPSNWNVCSYLHCATFPLNFPHPFPLSFPYSVCVFSLFAFEFTDHSLFDLICF